MSSCIDSYHASILIERILRGILSNQPRDDIEAIFSDLRLMGASNISPCMECAPCYDFIFYSKTLKKVCDGVLSNDKLERELHIWRKTQLRDEALTYMREGINKNDFNKVPVELLGAKIYLDQNVLSLYAQCSDITNRLDDLNSGVNFNFFYSPSNLEEIFKIPDPTQKSLIIKALSKLTDNVVILPVEDKNSFFKEEPLFGLNRIEKFNGSTEALEELKLVSSKDRKFYLKKYDTKEHKDNIANNSDIFNTLAEDEFRELVCVSNSSLSEKSSFKNITSRVTALHAIYTLSNMLDLLGYKIDKKEKTQKSSLHDIEHLIYGLDSDLFVTNDGNLKFRAMQIYKFMNSKVKVITLEQLMNVV